MTFLPEAVTLFGAHTFGSKNRGYASNQIVAAWGQKNPQLFLEVFYRPKIIKWARRENEKNGREWRLVWCPGKSLNEMREIAPIKKGKSVSLFDTKTRWWHGAATEKDPGFTRSELIDAPSKDELWAHTSGPSAYYLIDFKPRHPGETSNDPLGITAPAPEWLLASAAFSIFLASDERVLQKCMHLGPSKSAAGNPIQMGYFGENGMSFIAKDVSCENCSSIVYIPPHFPKSKAT